MEEKFRQIKELIHNEPDYKHEGNIDWDKLRSIILAVEDFTRKISDKRTFQQKAFHALVEMLQNAYRYREPNTPVNLYVKKKDKKLFILTENYLSLDDLKNLKILIEMINSLSQEQLKEIKIEQLMTGKVEPKFKKYNGMMSIRRRTDNKLHYHFERTPEGNSLVALIATINLN